MRGREAEKAVNRLLEKLDLSFDQAIVLVAVFRGAGAKRPKELAAMLGHGKSRLSQILSHLEEMQFLRRVVDPDDARSYYLKPRVERRSDITKVMNAFERIERTI